MAIMTYAQALEFAVEYLREENEDVATRLEELKIQLAKRGSGKKSMTKTQKENIEVKEHILALLGEGGLTATEVAAELGVTVQKASALLRQLVKDEKVARVKEGKVLRFAVI